MNESFSSLDGENLLFKKPYLIQTVLYKALNTKRLIKASFEQQQKRTRQQGIIELMQRAITHRAMMR